MPDYSLGRAHGKIEIDYDGSGAQKAAADIEKTAASADNLDKSLSKAQESLKDTEREFDKAGRSADDYSHRVRDVDDAHTSLHHSHGQARDDMGRFVAGAQQAEQSADHFKDALHGLTIAASLFGPEARAGALAVEKLADGFGDVGEKAAAANQHIRDFIKGVGSFEASFAKIAGITLSVPSLGGLAGIGGAASVQGLVDVADAVRQLSGALGLLPAVISGVGFSMGTLKIAFHGVGDALKDMMADDPKKFLQDIANMGPAAAHSMLQIAQFRDQFKLAGGAIQDSFFKQIANDIQPLIQTWLPALTKAGSQIAGIMGQAADQFAKLLMQPQMMQAFGTFIDNISKGLQAMQPAMKPLLDIFTQLTVVGSGFFQAIGGQITQMLNFFDQVVSKAAQSGALQRWITEGVNAFGHLVNIAYSFGAAFNHIMEVAEQFGGGGLLGWLDKLTQELNTWTQSAAGQKALTEFFTTMRQATDAFLPILGPLMGGIVSIGSAFVKLGTATAPAWLDFFKTFAHEMSTDLGPAIQGMGPALANFLQGLTTAFRQLAQTLGPQLPQIFEGLANAFVQILPQLPQMAADFMKLVEAVSPQLGPLFASITDALNQLTPLMPQIITLFREFVSAVTILTQVIGGLVEGGAKLVGFIASLPGDLGKIGNIVGGFFTKLAGQGEQWGRDLIEGFINGIKSLSGDVSAVVKGITDHIPQVVKDAWGIRSPSTVFHEIGVNTMLGLQQGLTAGAPAAVAATSAIAGQVTGTMVSGLSGGALGGSGGAPSPSGMEGVGGALLPANIAGADTSILDAYLNHQFDDNHGLKGLAKDLGNMLSVFQNGFNLLAQNMVQPMIQAMGLTRANNQRWVQLSAAAIGAEQAQKLQREALQGSQSPTWGQTLAPDGGAFGPSASQIGGQIPLGLTASSSKADIQKAIIAAGRARGMSDADIQTALAVAAAESGFNPTISGGMQGSAGEVLGLFQQSPSAGWGTRAQVTDPNYAINKFYDAFAQQLANNPTNPLLAAVLTQNPQLGGGAQGSAYMQAVQNQLGLANSIMQAYGPGVKGPTWPQLTGDGLSLPGATPIAPVPSSAWFGTGGPAGISANPSSRAGTLGGANANYTPETMAAAGIAPLFTKQAAGSMAGAPAWVSQLAAAFGLTATDHADSTLHGGVGQMGSWAFDFSGSVENMQKFADFIRTNLASQTLQAIWQNPQTGAQLGIAGGQILGPGQYYTTPGGTYADHTDHVHFATDVPVLINGQVPPGSMVGPTGYPDVNNARQLLDNSQQQLTVNQQLLQAYLQGNPALAQQIGAAQMPGASGAQVQQTLGSIDTAITGLKAQDAIGNKNTIDALQASQSQIAQQQGFTQAPSMVSTMSQFMGGAAQSITSVIQAVQSGLDAMAGTQDIADHLVYGIRNTEDINTIIDDFQKYIQFGASVANAAGQIMTAIGGIAGAAGEASGQPGAGSAGGALSSAGQIAMLISGVMQGVNAAIDFGQQIYHIAGTYVGRMLSTLAAGPFGTPLMGNVRFLLNKNTNQLISYSEDNPLNKNALNVPSWLLPTYDSGSGRNPNPQFGPSTVIYAGPGASASELFNHANWAAATAGTSGAMAARNF